MVGPSRGEVWLCDLNPTRGHEQAGHQRTYLVVSANGFNQGTSGLVIICPVTKVNRNIPFHVPVSTQESKLTFDSVIECDQVRSISVERLKNKVGVQAPRPHNGEGGGEAETAPKHPLTLCRPTIFSSKHK